MNKERIVKIMRTCEHKYELNDLCITPFDNWERQLVRIIDSYLHGFDQIQTRLHHWYYKLGLSTNIDHALISACANGNLEFVKYLVSHGANIHAQNDRILISVCENGHLEVVKYLIDLGVNINARYDFAVRMASYNGHLEVVKYLVISGADIHAKHDYAIRMASEYGHLEVFKFLKRQ